MFGVGFWVRIRINLDGDVCNNRGFGFVEVGCQSEAQSSSVANGSVTHRNVIARCQPYPGGGLAQCNNAGDWVLEEKHPTDM